MALFLSVGNNHKKLNKRCNIILNNMKAIYAMKDGILCFNKSNVKTNSQSS